jgi:hypothetical protein
MGVNAGDSWLFSGQVCNERGRPGLAAVIGVGFLEVMRVRCDVGPYAAHQDRAVIDYIRGEEFAAPVLEGADQGRDSRRSASMKKD